MTGKMEVGDTIVANFLTSSLAINLQSNNETKTLYSGTSQNVGNEWAEYFLFSTFLCSINHKHILTSTVSSHQLLPS